MSHSILFLHRYHHSMHYKLKSCFIWQLGKGKLDRTHTGYNLYHTWNLSIALQTLYTVKRLFKMCFT